MSAYMSPLIVPIAAHDLDLAFEGLVSLLSSGPPEDGGCDEVREWAHFVCTYTRYVHLNTWADDESVERVEGEFLPEFLRASGFLVDLLEKRTCFRFSREECKKLKKYTANIVARHKNLRDNFCRGLDSAFDAAAADPSA